MEVIFYRPKSKKEHSEICRVVHQNPDTEMCKLAWEDGGDMYPYLGFYPDDEVVSGWQDADDWYDSYMCSNKIEFIQKLGIPYTFKRKVFKKSVKCFIPKECQRQFVRIFGENRYLIQNFELLDKADIDTYSWITLNPTNDGESLHYNGWMSEPSRFSEIGYSDLISMLQDDGDACELSPKIKRQKPNNHGNKEKSITKIVQRANLSVGSRNPGRGSSIKGARKQIRIGSGRGHNAKRLVA